jgi:hypothetical protein
MKKSLLVASVAALSLSASLAHAADALGTAGSISVSGSVPVLGVAMISPPAGDSLTVTSVGPDLSIGSFAVNYWVTNDITLGGALQFTGNQRDKDSSGMTIAPSIGYRYAMGDATLWPKLQPMYSSATTKDLATGKESTDSKFAIGVEVPYLWTRGAFFHGPAVNLALDLSSKNGDADGAKTTAFGLSYQVGGSF